MLTVYIDGSGKYGRYAFIVEKSGKIFKIGIFKKSGITNNQAEYLALLEVLKRFSKEDLLVYSDSQLLVNQLKMKYKIKNEKLKALARIAFEKMQGRNVEIKWIPRKQNKAGKLI